MIHAVAVPTPARSRRPLAALVLLGALTAAVAGGCSDDGRTLAPVDPDLTTTSVGEVLGAPEVGSAAPSGEVLLSTDGFVPGGELVAEYTCAGAGVSPPLSWTPPGAGAELAVVLRERDEARTVHWVVTGIDPVVVGFGAGKVPEGAVEQVNSSGATGYLPPCPASGTGTHTYEFVLHVLDVPFAVDPAVPAGELADALEEASRVEAPLTATVATG